MNKKEAPLNKQRTKSEDFFDRENEQLTGRQNGMPRYRHLYKPYWFLPLFVKDTPRGRVSAAL